MQTLLTDEQIEATYGINRKTLANWRVKGRGPSFVKIGAAVRYRPEDLKQWIEGHVFQSTAAYKRMAVNKNKNILA